MKTFVLYIFKISIYQMMMGLTRISL